MDAATICLTIAFFASLLYIADVAFIKSEFIGQLWRIVACAFILMALITSVNNTGATITNTLTTNVPYCQSNGTRFLIENDNSIMVSNAVNVGLGINLLNTERSYPNTTNTITISNVIKRIPFVNTTCAFTTQFKSETMINQPGPYIQSGETILIYIFGVMLAMFVYQFSKDAMDAWKGKKTLIDQP